ncbi:MAG: CARDB domain-containing protein [Phycisphaeraceae bacterium]
MLTTLRLLSLFMLLTFALFGCQQQPTELLGIDRPSQPLRPLSDQVVTGQFAYPTGDVETGTLLISKHLPGQVRAGAPFEYEITVMNLTDEPMENILITEELPPFLTLHGGATLNRLDEPAIAGFENGDQPGPSEADDAFVIYSPREEPALADEMVFGIERSEKQTQPISGGEWRIQRLEPNEMRTLRLVGVADEQGLAETLTSVQDEPAMTLAIDAVDPTIRIERWSPPMAMACETIPVFYRITNTSDATVSEILLAETLPEGQFFGEREDEITMEIGDLEPGEQVEFRIDTYVTEPGVYEGQVVATDRYGVSFESSTTTTQAVAPELQIDINMPDEAHTQQNVPITVAITNTGNAIAEDLRVRSMLPSDVTVRQVSDTGLIRNNEIEWVFAALEPGQTAELSLQLAAAQPGAVRMVVVADAECAEEQTVAAATQFQGVSSLRLELRDHADPVPIGQQEQYSITLTNQGNMADENVEVIATVPDELRLIEALGPGEAEIDGQQVRFTINRLRPRQTISLQIITEALRPADVRFEVRVDSDNLTRPVITNEATRLF